MSRHRAATAIVLTLFLTGCGGLLSRTKSRFFSLERIPPSGGVVALAGPPVGVDVVELPPGYDRREIVVHEEGQRVEVRERDQWTGSLESMVLHTLAFDLADRLPEGMVILPGQPVPNGPMRGVDLVVAKLAAGPGKVVTLDARWRLRRSGAPLLARHEMITIDIASLDSAEVAMGFSRAIATLADRIVAQLGATP